MLTLHSIDHYISHPVTLTTTRCLSPLHLKSSPMDHLPYTFLSLTHLEARLLGLHLGNLTYGPAHLAQIWGGFPQKSLSFNMAHLALGQLPLITTSVMNVAMLVCKCHIQIMIRKLTDKGITMLCQIFIMFVRSLYISKSTMLICCFVT